MKNSLYDFCQNEDQLHKSILEYCNDNNLDKVQKFLKENPKFNLLYENGYDDESVLFDLACSRDSAEIFEALLEHYKRNKLEDKLINDDLLEMNLDYKVAKSKIVKILDDNYSRACKEIQKLIDPYLINTLEGSDSEKDLDYAELIDIGISEDKFKSVNIAKELLNHISTKEGCELIEAINEGDYDANDIDRAFEDVVDILETRGLEFFSKLAQHPEEIREYSLQEVLNNIVHKKNRDEFDDYSYIEKDEVEEAIDRIKRNDLGDYDLERYGSEVEYSGESEENYDY